MFEQLLLHGVGDYLTQTSWMATNKKNKGLIGFLACFVHCSIYALPFLLIGSPLAVLVIFLTHFTIDRSHLIERYIAFINRGDPKVNFGYPADRPIFLTLWLYIIVDNMFHLLCNYAALSLL
jgi:hypothetical protein